jgi:NAD+ kinase
MAGPGTAQASRSDCWPDGGVLGVVVHPRRAIDDALESARSWASGHGGTMAQVAIDGQERRVADLVSADESDLLLAVGGDGTVLAALHAAAPAGRRVLGVACGSLGALTSVKAEDVRAALDRFATGAWEPRTLPQLAVRRDGAVAGEAFNDMVVVRRGAGQVILDVSVDGVTYARLAGDGVVVATPLGSSAYTLAAGGPLVAAAADVMVLTPLAAHGGSVPPVVLDARSVVRIGVDGGWSGARLEIDGKVVGDVEPPGETKPFTLEIAMQSCAATLLDFDGETLVSGLRRRGVIADSPRLAARDARASARVASPREG